MPSPSEHDPATQPKDAAANSAAYRSRFFTVSPDLLAVIAADGLLQDVNPAWEQMLGVPLTDLRGRSYLSFVRGNETTQRPPASLGRLHRWCQEQQAEDVVQRPSGIEQQLKGHEGESKLSAPFRPGGRCLEDG